MRLWKTQKAIGVEYIKELEETTIEQIRTLLYNLEQRDLLNNRDILRCLDLITREYGGKVVDGNYNSFNWLDIFTFISWNEKRYQWADTK